MFFILSHMFFILSHAHMDHICHCKISSSGSCCQSGLQPCQSWLFQSSSTGHIEKLYHSYDLSHNHQYGNNLLCDSTYPRCLSLVVHVPSTTMWPWPILNRCLFTFIHISILRSSSDLIWFEHVPFTFIRISISRSTSMRRWWSITWRSSLLGVNFLY